MVHRRSDRSFNVLDLTFHIVRKSLPAESRVVWIRFYPHYSIALSQVKIGILATMHTDIEYQVTLQS